MSEREGRKPLFWIGSSLEDLSAFPGDVKLVMGFALHIAQAGGKHIDAKPLKGFGGSGVLEIIGDHAGDTFRAAYTVRFEDAVYVLHAFQKKSKKGIRTSKRDVDLLRMRLKRAEEHHERWRKEK